MRNEVWRKGRFVFENLYSFDVQDEIRSEDLELQLEVNELLIAWVNEIISCEARQWASRMKKYF